MSLKEDFVAAIEKLGFRWDSGISNAWDLYKSDTIAVDGRPLRVTVDAFVHRAQVSDGVRVVIDGAFDDILDYIRAAKDSLVEGRPEIVFANSENRPSPTVKDVLETMCGFEEFEAARDGLELTGAEALVILKELMAKSPILDRSVRLRVWEDRRKKQRISS